MEDIGFKRRRTRTECIVYGGCREGSQEGGRIRAGGVVGQKQNCADGRRSVSLGKGGYGRMWILPAEKRGMA